MAAFRIFIADDHEVVRKGLCALLQGEQGWEVCGEAADGRAATEKVRELKPDVSILDIGMPGLNGLEATRQIIKDDPRARVLILTFHDSDQVSDAARDLVVAVEALRRDKTYFTSKVAAMVLEGYLKGGTKAAAISLGRDRLTPREREVVQLLAEGKSTKEVAVALGLSVKTAETHRSNIMRKLQLHSVSDLVLYAVRNNIVHVVQSTID